MAIRVVTTLSPTELAHCQHVINCAKFKLEGDCRLIDASPRNGLGLSLNQKGYVQIKVSGDDPNKKVQLHQFIAWQHPDPVRREQLREAIKHTTLEISHLCNNKSCANPDHLFAETSARNKERNTCEVVVKLNEKLYDICRHEPKCVRTKRVLERAFSFNIFN